MRPRVRRPRLPDWGSRLAALVEERRDAPFAWGRHDCAMFAADAVLAITGRDPLAAWRGAYSTEEGGAAITDPAGGFEAFMVAAFADHGSPDCPVAFAQRGDVALIQLRNLVSLAVVLDGVVAAPGTDGIEFLRPRVVRRVWAV